MDLKVSKNLENKKLKKPKVKGVDRIKDFKSSKKAIKPISESSEKPIWNYLLVFVVTVGVFGVLIFELVNLQVVQR